MREMTTKEIKNVLLNILIYVDQVCKSNNINYSLAHGTLLGAVRHKGFIPWDDDIDIFLRRPEYNRLIDILYKSDNKKYKVFSPKDKGYYYPYAKVSDMDTAIIEKNWPQYKDLGLNIDIFPIDYVPENRAREYYDKTKEYENCLYNSLTDIAYVHNNKIVSILKRILRFRQVKECRKKGEEYWKNKISEMTQIEKTNKIACIVTGGFRLWDKEMFDSFIEIEFENRKFQAVEDYDTMLKSIYGNYMELPPIEQRESYHDFTAFLK